jgi:hypothetical protein
MLEAQNALAETLSFGGKLMLAIDEMPSPDRVKEWREMYDPDVHHLINAHVMPLPSELWHPHDLRMQELMIKIGALHPDEDEATLGERFSQIQFEKFEFVLWSKFKVREREMGKAGKQRQGEGEEEKAIEEGLREAFKKRFERSMPM